MAYWERKIRLQKNIYGKIPFLQTFLITQYLTEEPEILNWMPEYRLPLIVPGEIQQFEKFQTEFGKTMQFINSAKDKGTMRK